MYHPFRKTVFLWVAFLLTAYLVEREELRAAEPDEKKVVPTTVDLDTTGLVPLNKEETVYIDRKGNRLLVRSKVVLRRGLLEMLCCLKDTKEHESILVTTARSYIVHGGLLALGVEPGRPVRYYPKFVPADGPKVKINVIWTDENGKQQKSDSQEWIRYVVDRYYYEVVDPYPKGLVLPDNGEGDLRYDTFSKELFWFGHMSKKKRDELKKLSANEKYQQAIDKFYKESQPRVMDTGYIFTGSRFVEDEETKKQIYLAEDGCLICVANMPTAMVDVGIESSSQGTDNLLFEPFTERIPPLGTEVIIEIIPVKEPAAEESKNTPEEKNAEGE
ncbi:MAG: hypothetical protein KDA65_08690 [Planctomycetaceae bacterium]|nr:hypothetical protein [Planctomycetaceae bacterium]